MSTRQTTVGQLTAADLGKWVEMYGLSGELREVRHLIHVTSALLDTRYEFKRDGAWASSESAAEWIAKRREHLTAAAAANRRHAPLPFDQREVNRMAVALEALEAVLVFATSERDKISRTYIEQPAMDDVIRTIEGVLGGES